MDGEMLHQQGCLYSRGDARLQIPRQCSLFQAKYPRIVNFVECSVANNLDQRLVIRDDDEVIAALCEAA